MKHFILCALFVVTFQSCTSIEQPIASQKLVVASADFKKNKVEKELWGPLKGEATRQHVIVGGLGVSFGDKYVSALGLACREVSFDNAFKVKIACHDVQTNTWFYTKQVLSTYSGEIK